MSRIIKFRAWDKEFKEMVEITGINWRNGTCQLARQLFPENWHNLSEFILMEFTELLDKNNKEIWEGDIVKWAWTKPEEVIFEHNHGWHPLNTYNLNWWNDAEVIGNFYKNPSLLEKGE